MRRLIGRWLPPLVWMGIIFVVSDQPAVPVIPGLWDLLVKKTMHALAYGVLTVLLLRALRGYWSGERAIRLVSIGLAVAYALSDEYHQTLVPGRDGNVIDVMVDAVGVVGAIALDWGRRQQQRREAG